MRQQVVCVEGNTAEETESALNEKLLALGPNNETLSVQCCVVDARGQPHILLVALTQLTAENNIADWPLDRLDLTAEECERLRAFAGPRGITSVYELMVTCGIGKTLAEHDWMLFKAVTLALAKHGFHLSGR